jgi:predicted pyridoxine 5'-phosphate oxidase superfamily flavin-nucleotide-binding protein
MSIIATVEELEAIYGHPNDASTVKVADRVTPPYRAAICLALSAFMMKRR